MRLALLIALLAPLAGLSWLLEAEDPVCVPAVVRETQASRPPPTLAPLRYARPQAVAVAGDCVPVSGHVVGEAGRPVAGARVVSRDDDEAVRCTAVTDARGAFHLAHAFWDGTIEVDAGVRGRARLWLDEEDRRDLRIGVIPGAELRGRVLAPDGATPVASALATAEEDEFGCVEVRTDADGRFVLSPVPKRREFEVLVDGGACGRVRLSDVRWAENASLDVVLERVRALGGRVVTRGAAGVLVGVAGVEVRAHERLRGKPQGAGVRTDADGRFRCHVYGFQGLLEVVSEAWFHPLGASSFLGPGEMVVEVVPRATLRGRCELADGTPVAGAVVTCSDPMASGEVRSDSSGRFEIQRVGFLRTSGQGIMARLGGLVGRRCVTKASEPGHEPVVVLEPTASVQGRVLDEDGTPSAQVWAKVRYVPDPVERPDDVEYEYEITDAEGRFLVAELPVGPCTLEIEAAGFEHPRFETCARLAGTQLGDIRLTRRARRHGQLVDPEGAPISDGTCSVQEESGRRLPVHADGSFAIALPGDPESEVVFAAPGFLARTFEIRELPRAGPWRIVLEPCPTLAGRVLDREGRPVPTAIVSAAGQGHDGEGWACVDTDGRFCMELTRAGTYELELDAGQRWKLEPLVVASGTRGLILRPAELPCLRGRVLGPDGRGLSGAGVSAWDADVGRSTTRHVLTGEDGGFVLAGLEGQWWHVSAEWLPEGLGAPQRWYVPVDTDEVVLTAMRTLVIEGRILGMCEDWPGDFGVDVEALGYRECSGSLTMEPDGTFRIGDLLPGLYQLSGWRRTSRTDRERSEPVRVRAGTGNVLLVLEPVEEGEPRR